MHRSTTHAGLTVITTAGDRQMGSKCLSVGLHNHMVCEYEVCLLCLSATTALDSIYSCALHYWSPCITHAYHTHTHAHTHTHTHTMIFEWWENEREIHWNPSHLQFTGIKGTLQLTLFTSHWIHTVSVV